MKIALALVGALVVSGSAYAQASLSAADREEIQALTAQYAKALNGCDADGFAKLFAPSTGYFASGFRGKVQGKNLQALVESERHCLTPNADGSRGRPAGQAPTAVIEQGANGVTGLVDLGGAEYQDEYVKTADGWRFAARTVVIPPEKAAGIDAKQMVALWNLSADLPTVDHYDTAENGKRYLSTGPVIRVQDGVVRGRVYKQDGSYFEDVYEQTAPGQWRIKSRESVAAAE